MVSGSQWRCNRFQTRGHRIKKHPYLEEGTILGVPGPRQFHDKFEQKLDYMINTHTLKSAGSLARKSHESPMATQLGKVSRAAKRHQILLPIRGKLLTGEDMLYRRNMHYPIRLYATRVPTRRQHGQR